MNIYLIERNPDVDKKEIYEAFLSHIVICESKIRCRELASSISDFEGKEVWFNKTTKVKLLGIPYFKYYKEQIIMSEGNHI